MTWLGWEIPRWVLMWFIAVTMFAILKILSLAWAKDLHAGGAKIAAFLLLWPGMDAPAFLTGRTRRPPNAGEWTAAALKTALAIILIVFAPAAGQPMVRGWIAMAGIVLLLHFGSFHLLSCFWRSRGVDAPPLMDRPLLATSVGAFWGRHWNVAFRDLAHRLVFQPVKRRQGAHAALMAVFFFSGLVHELAITIPAGGWYGGPTAFFILQGLAALAEKTKRGRKFGLGQGGRGRVFVLGLLIFTAPLLFPPPFVLRIINPFIDFLHEFAF